MGGSIRIAVAAAAQRPRCSGAAALPLLQRHAQLRWQGAPACQAARGAPRHAPVGAAVTATQHQALPPAAAAPLPPQRCRRCRPHQLEHVFVARIGCDRAQRPRLAQVALVRLDRRGRGRVERAAAVQRPKLGARSALVAVRADAAREQRRGAPHHYMRQRGALVDHGSRYGGLRGRGHRVQRGTAHGCCRGLLICLTPISYCRGV